MPTRRTFLGAVAANCAVIGRLKSEPAFIRSARTGVWTSPSTWEGKQVPAPGAKVQILAGHKVIYDVDASEPLRMVHVLGTLSFARDRNTCLPVGLLKIGGDDSEDGFNCVHHSDGKSRPALEVGTPNEPLPDAYTARIRLAYFDGLDQESFPSLMCCGGR